MLLGPTPEIAAKFASIALDHITREYPHKLDHVMNGPDDIEGPRQLHPIFFGSFDWHSCVHGYWLLLQIRRGFPALPVTEQITSLAVNMLTQDKVRGELAYLSRPSSAGFERPYGWAWLLSLHQEAQLHNDQPWADNLEPLARAFSDRLKGYLPKLTYPIRVGTHFNTAFSLILALEWAKVNDQELEALIRTRARDYFQDDSSCAAWEPGGDEFLSSSMIEAFCMKRVLDTDEFEGWLKRFFPRLEFSEPTSIFRPAFVSDRSDGKIAHLDGFNFSRAWCWRGLSTGLDPALAEVASVTADRHLDESMPHVAGDYMGEHWLATFAWLALSERDSARDR